MRDENNLAWLLVAIAAVGFTLWYQSSGSDRQANIQQLQTQLQNCQSGFKAFKDGVIYGKQSR